MADDKKEEKKRDPKAILREIPPMIEETKKAIGAVEALDEKISKYVHVKGAVKVLNNARNALIIMKANLEDELAG